MEKESDIIIVGGGLAGGLTALALAARRPDLRLLLVDGGENFGGNHIWSFFTEDIARENRWLIEPLIEKSWKRYEVRFHRYRKVFGSTYNSITSERLDAALRQALPEAARLTGQIATKITPDSVTLADGRVLTAGAVIDARGCTSYPHLQGGWQKFLGQMVRLSSPHTITRPILMDARVAQRGGYRFIYVLPFGPDQLFIEDTYYSLSSEIDADLMRQRIAEYCRLSTWKVAEIIREERGLLPVVASGDFAAFWQASGEDDVARIGAAAGLFHPLTSYSLPSAVAMACRLAKLHDYSTARLARDSKKWAQEHWEDSRYFRRLSQMLFGAATPKRRYKVFEHFFRMEKTRIERFFANRFNRGDKIRLLLGKPPVPIGAAISALRGHGNPLSPLVPGAENDAEQDRDDEGK